MRKAFLLGCWIIAVCVVAAADKSLDLPKSTGRVNDFAGVINPQAKKSLARLCLELDEKTHAQIAVVTIASTGHTPIADYAFALFNHWGIGHKDDNRGLLVLLAISDRHWRITTGRGFETLFPDDRVASIGAEMLPDLRAHHYSDALLHTTRELANIIARERGVQLTDPDSNLLPEPTRPVAKRTP